MWQLSEYLIPRMTKAEVEEKAQEFVYHHLPGARDNQLQNNAFDMAEKLGLRIERYTLWGHRRTRSILFFHQGTIAVKEYHSSKSRRTAVWHGSQPQGHVPVSISQ